MCLFLPHASCLPRPSSSFLCFLKPRQVTGQKKRRKRPRRGRRRVTEAAHRNGEVGLQVLLHLLSPSLSLRCLRTRGDTRLPSACLLFFFVFLLLIQLSFVAKVFFFACPAICAASFLSSFHLHKLGLHCLSFFFFLRPSQLASFFLSLFFPFEVPPLLRLSPC